MLIEYGRGSRSASAKIRFDHDTASLTAFNGWSYNDVEIPFDFMRDLGQAPFADSRESRDELRRRINEAGPTENVPSEDERIRPSFKLEALADEQAREEFFAALQWASTRRSTCRRLDAASSGA